MDGERLIMKCCVRSTLALNGFTRFMIAIYDLLNYLMSFSNFLVRKKKEKKINEISFTV